MVMEPFAQRAGASIASTNIVGPLPAASVFSTRDLTVAWFDLPLDYLDTWSAEIDKITASQIQQAFARNLQPARMVTVVLGAKP
jgi:hypothetical protein